MRPLRAIHGLAWLCLLALLAACGSSTVRTTAVTPVLSGDPAVPEEQLLDVGVRLFNPGVEQLTEEEIFTAPEIRKAEARYIPTTLVDTLQKSGHWGAVRVMPVETGVTDVMIDGRILESTGERLEIEIRVDDASGAHWYTRRYAGGASKYSYDGKSIIAEPFQDIYNRIANDLALERAKLKDEDARRLRAISELRFAESFSAEAFGGYLDKERDRYKVRRLPAEDDPMLVRVRQIRERDNLFVDTLQDYYNGFSKQMAGPYQDWRKETYAETIEYHALKKQATMRTVAGIAAILGGIAAQSGDSYATRTAGVVGIVGGASMIKSGFDKRAEAKMHAETLRELGASLGGEIEPQVIELDERSITLTGTVQDQYGQWREILRGIYATETGSI